MFIDGPIFKESSLFNNAERGISLHADSFANMYHMRQLSVASVLSVDKDFMYYKVNILNVGDHVNVTAMLTHHPNYWNQVGYPAQGDLVLIMHQRQFNDAHILMRLQTKEIPITEHVTLKNADGITAGTLMP
jgi:hypothetical protein